MREYDIPDKIAGNKITTGLYVNYPYNFLDHDPFLGRDKATLDRPGNRSVQTKGGAFRDKDKYDSTGLSNVDVTPPSNNTLYTEL